MTMDWISQHIYSYVVNLQLYNYHYRFVGHCSAFCGLKWRIWRAKICFTRWNKPDCFIVNFPFFSLNALQSDINSNRF